MAAHGLSFAAGIKGHHDDKDLGPGLHVKNDRGMGFVGGYGPPIPMPLKFGMARRKHLCPTAILAKAL